jgi:hypothetical protein
MFIPIGTYFEVSWLIQCGGVIIPIVAIAAVIYANTGNRFHKKDGAKMSSVFERKNQKTSKANKIVPIVFAMILLIVVGGVLLYCEKEPAINVSDSQIQIKAMYGVDIDFSDVTNVSLIEESMKDIGIGSKVNGFDGIRTFKGHFKSDSLWETLLFVQSNSSPTIRIERNNEKDIYISFRAAEKTERLFDELTTVVIK